MEKVVYQEEVYTVSYRYFDALFIITFVVIKKDDVKLTVPEKEVLYI